MSEREFLKSLIIALKESSYPVAAKLLNSRKNVWKLLESNNNMLGTVGIKVSCKTTQTDYYYVDPLNLHDNDLHSTYLYSENSKQWYFGKGDTLYR